MEKKEIIEEGLRNFSGSEQVYKFNLLFPNVLMTDGVRWLANKAECYWLLEMIASHIRAIKDDYMAVCRLKVQGRTAVFTMDNGNAGSDNVFVTQTIEYTDFPLDEIKLYVKEDADDKWIILLPSEN